MEQNENNIKEYMEEDNIISFYFKQKNVKHFKSCNIKCLNALVYKIIIGKSVKILNKHVIFVNHLKNMDGSNA